MYNSVLAAFLGPIYIVLYLALIGLLIYIFGVKFAYFGQACDIAISKKDDLLDIESEEEIKKRA
ncbi:hypothetical protein B0I63_003430 [Clostridium beijerinckii]|uniref:Uncharacterized protein n=1 Tax=Clostridium beijerinckii TaxID=1520 RepID=A0A9Q5GIZ0_CLOBE|nr:hypothetical protein [Clostridium beijerinckii]AQS05807.1 hypothetical protein CLBIJ_32500 [Clostridium beijerinckii]MBA2885438.1 hypothetical protein [Clostridium beijerinckii]MBA2900061.1 hypothetical protein [Clostridium beijerinckii]MBA2909690.1 hypothetical protein [Clostridium beijerinckii]MBA9014595.1 hypothetical protein [Clostridium beijerinckii]